MAMGILRKKLDLNPELEALRNKGLREGTSETNDWILRMINKTSSIHAGFLFEDLQTLQNLCLFISETQNKITDAGWEAFGYHLGLSPSVLKVINYNNFNKEDPCYNVLLAYVQYDDASIGKIIKALYSLGRVDVLSRIQPFINDLAKTILQFNGNYETSNLVEETSDYESLSSCDESANSNSSNGGELTCQTLIKPKIIPPAPFIFQNLQATPEFTSQQIKQSLCNVLKSFSNSKSNESNINTSLNQKITCNNEFLEVYNPKIVTESLQSQSISSYNRKSFSAAKQKYKIKILLTFGEDGEKYAAEVCKVLRRNRENYPKIGVLVLSEHAATVNKDPEQFISGAFSQVDYVCPILTSGYFRLISKKQKATSLSNIHLDALYAPYIFRLMNSYFVSNDCLNDKIRCIIPENEFSLIPFKSLWTNPVFAAWVKLSEVDELALRLLNYKGKDL